MSDSSASKELKETIRKLREENAALKKKLGAPAAPSSAHGGGGEMPEDYLSETVFGLVSKRLGWLAFFLASLSLTAVVMEKYEHTLSRQLELAYFVPLLIGHGGNAGGQVVGTIIHALGAGQLQRRHCLQVVGRELAVAGAVGGGLGLVVWPVLRWGGGISSHVSTVVSLTLPLLTLVSGGLAALLPFAILACGLEPSTIAPPALTSLVDVFGLVVYFSVASSIFTYIGLAL